jgi:hypothetical protein
MNTETPNSNPVTTPLRCQYTTPKGRRCRQRVSTDTTLCWRHLHPAVRPKDVPDLAALAVKLRKFDSAADVHKYLASVLVSLAQERITPRQAAVFAYLCNMLLRSLTQIQLEEEAKDNVPIHVDWSNIPRPDYSQPTQPEDLYSTSDTMRQIAHLVPGFVPPGKEVK